MTLTPLSQPRASRASPKQSAFHEVAGPDSLLRGALTVESWLIVGACLQSLLFLILPSYYAFLPAVTLLIARITFTTLVTKGVLNNPYTVGAIQQKFSAQIPDREGNFNGPASDKVAVLHLGSKFNHPLGFFGPYGKEMGTFFQNMFQELDESVNEDNGYLGSTSYNRTDERGATELLNISYWRSVEDVHRYSQSPRHREAWDWWNKNAKQLGHIGIMHELFEVPKGMWETIYVNFQPILMGKNSYLKRNGKTESGHVAEQWIDGIVDASRGFMSASKGRMGRAVTSEERTASAY